MNHQTNKKTFEDNTKLTRSDRLSTLQSPWQSNRDTGGSKTQSHCADDLSEYFIDTSVTVCSSCAVRRFFILAFPKMNNIDPKKVKIIPTIDNDKKTSSLGLLTNKIMLT